jgi:hypothetical protein
MQGWVCPKCSKVYAPSVQECASCNAHLVTVTIGPGCGATTHLFSACARCGNSCDQCKPCPVCTGQVTAPIRFGEDIVPTWPVSITNAGYVPQAAMTQ